MKDIELCLKLKLSDTSFIIKGENAMFRNFNELRIVIPLEEEILKI